MTLSDASGRTRVSGFVWGDQLKVLILSHDFLQRYRGYTIDIGTAAHFGFREVLSHPTVHTVQ